MALGVGTVLKYVLIILNIVILIIGLVLALLGVLLVAGVQLFGNWEDSIKDTLQDVAEESGTTINTDDIDLQQMVKPVGYGLIGLGVLISIVSLLGCCGGCYVVKILLIIYTIIVSVFLLALGIFFIIVYADPSLFDSTAKEGLESTLKDYTGIEDDSGQAIAWNGLMAWYGCCGVSSYKDFDDTDWNNAEEFGSKGTITGLVTPFICCKDLKDARDNSDYTCARTPTTSTNNFETGCYDKLLDDFKSDAVFITVLVFMMIFLACVIALAILVMCCND